MSQIDIKAIENLTTQGLSLEEAINQVLAESNMTVAPVGSRIVVDRVAHINSLTSLKDLRGAVKSAYGKKSKAAGKEPQASRYQNEIKVGQARINELLAVIAVSDPQTAKELGAEPSDLLKLYLDRKGPEIDATLIQLKADNNWSNKDLKLLTNKESADPTTGINEELFGISVEVMDLYYDRGRRGDQLVQTLNRKAHLIERVEAGYLAETEVEEEELVSVVPSEDFIRADWEHESPDQATEEPVAEVVEEQVRGKKNRK